MSSIRVLPDFLVLEKRLVDLVRPACIDYIFVIVHLVVNHENLPPKGRTRLFLLALLLAITLPVIGLERSL